MTLSNFERMMQIAEKVFAAKSDPEQLDVDEKVIARIRNLHPSTVCEYDDGNGPAIWILLIPTTTELMNKFVKKEIAEKQLLDFTLPDSKYDTLYLCSAMTLPEYRKKGITKKLVLDAIGSIRKTHPLKALFVWPFTHEGDLLANDIALEVSLPLFKRTH